jgi:hypothetical protein
LVQVKGIPVRYFLRKIEKAITFAASLLKSKRKYHTLILIGDDGKIKHIRILRGLIVAVLSAQIIVVCAGAYFFSSGMRFEEDKKAIENELMVSQKKYLTIRDEKDMLMARLVLAESLANKDTDIVRVSKTAERSANTSADQIQKMTFDGGGISIDNINFFYETGAKKLKIQFDIINNQKSKQLSGYTFVILKENEIDEEGWLTVPSVPLVSKKPATINKGQYFSTSKPAKVSLMTNTRLLPPRFKSATVFVYSVSGVLILEKNYPVVLK